MVGLHAYTPRARLPHMVDHTQCTAFLMASCAGSTRPSRGSCMATYHPQGEPRPSVLTVAHTVYALHTFVIGVGLVGAAPVIGSFVGSVPSLLAVLLNYATRSDAHDTWV